MDEGREVLALHELHRQKHLIVDFADIEHAAHGRMGDLARQPDLVEEKRAPGRRRRAHQLERDGNAEHEIVGAPDVAHAALSQVSDHAVAAGEHFPGREDIGGRRGNHLAVGPNVFLV